MNVSIITPAIQNSMFGLLIFYGIDLINSRSVVLAVFGTDNKIQLSETLDTESMLEDFLAQLGLIPGNSFQHS